MTKQPLFPHIPSKREPLFPHMARGQQPATKLPATRYEFFPESVRRRLPPLGATGEQKDPMVQVKFFTPWTNWTWYGIEFDGKDIFFGWVVGLEKEFGSFSLSELQSLRGPGDLKIERDIYFEPKPISQVMKEHGESLALPATRGTPGGTEVYVEKLPKCDFCSRPALYDAKTTMGPWAHMCQEHYLKHGIGLGVGKGQKLIPRKALGEAEKIRGEPPKELAVRMTEEDFEAATLEDMWYPVCPYCGASTPAEPDAHAIYCQACNRRFKIVNPFFSSLELLASTEGDPRGRPRKFCCQQCGECAPKELLEEGKFPERIDWLRSHYKARHPSIWGKGSTASDYDKELEQLRRDLHDKAISEEAYKKAVKEILERKHRARAILPQTDSADWLRLLKEVPSHPPEKPGTYGFGGDYGRI